MKRTEAWLRAAARTVMLNNHLPLLILFLMYFVALFSGGLAGCAMAKRNRRSLFHIFLYAACLALNVFTIIDMDDPRSGLSKGTPSGTARPPVFGGLFMHLQ